MVGMLVGGVSVQCHVVTLIKRPVRDAYLFSLKFD